MLIVVLVSCARSPSLADPHGWSREYHSAKRWDSNSTFI
jgi:hypothetical protein